MRFRFAPVDGELRVNALTPPTPALSAEPSLILQNPHLLTCCEGWLLSKATSAPCSGHMAAEQPASEA